MKIVINSVKITLRNQDAVILPITLFGVNSDNCKLIDVSNEKGTLLIIIEHKKLLTLLDVSGVDNHLLISFDEGKKFMGATYCHTIEDRSFIISSQARYAVFIAHDQLDFSASSIIEFELYPANLYQQHNNG